MPRYDFRCRACAAEFEALVGFSSQVTCPHCSGTELQRLFSPIAGPMKTGVRGGDARRSDATRRAREEVRQEGFRQQREKRAREGG